MKQMNMDWQNLMAPAAWILHGGAFVLGACIGSFLNVVIWRVPRGESLISPPSHCPKCGHPIRPWENVPILAWLCLRGHCSACQNPISIRYPSVELLTALIFLGVWLRTWQGLYPLATLPSLMILAAIVIIAAFTDYDLRMIPNKATYTGMIAAVLLALTMPEGRSLTIDTLFTDTFGARVLIAPLIHQWSILTTQPRLAAVADVALSAGLTWLIAMFMRELGRRCFRRTLLKANPEHPPDALGMGDVKLLVAIAALLGFEPLVFILLLASASGFGFGVARWIGGRRADALMIPFGPFIAFSTIAWILAGNIIHSVFQTIFF